MWNICEIYARQWAKKEDVELDTLSEWIKSIRDVVKRRIRRLKHSVNTRYESIFRDPDVVHVSRLHENFAIVPADKASNNYTFVCKKHYVDILIEELGLHLLPGNPTYNLTDFSASEVLDNHKSVLTSFGIQTNNEELDLPYIYWIPKMHTNPFKHRFIAGSSKCSTKPLSILLTKLLTHIKQGLQKYCETAFSRSGINQMWILKNSKELLDHLKSPNFNLITNIKSFDFSTLYTTIPHQKLKSRLATIIRNSFIHKNGNRRYKYLVLCREGPYFVREHSDSKSKYTEEDLIRMLEFLVDNIFVVWWLWPVPIKVVRTIFYCRNNIFRMSLNDIWMMPLGHPWAIWYIQDGGQYGLRTSKTVYNLKEIQVSCIFERKRELFSTEMIIKKSKILNLSNRYTKKLFRKII